VIRIIEDLGIRNFLGVVGRDWMDGWMDGL